MSASASKNLKIGVVGFGPFGQFLAKTMVKQGHILSATSRTDYSELCADLGITFFRDAALFLKEQHDVIMLCTSILSLSKVLRSIPFHSMKEPALFVDVLSVKEYPRDMLLQVLPQDSDLLCTHPMFGPESGKNGWKDLNFMYERVRVRDEKTCSSFLRIFEIEGCRMLEMSCTDHDIMAARSQFITHTVGRILSELEVVSTSIDTKGFQSLLELLPSLDGIEPLKGKLDSFAYVQKKNTEKDSFDLFSGLYIHNRFARQELKNLEVAFESLKQKLLTGSKEEQEENCKGQ